MISRSRSTRHAGKAHYPLIGVVCVLVVVVGGVFAYKLMFRRAGEDAAALIPSDAAVVATLDATPGPDQVVLFGRIKKAMANEHIKDLLETALAPSKNGKSFVDDVVPELETGYAFGAWSKPGAKPSDDPEMVGLATVANTGAVEVIAAKHGTQMQKGSLSYYNISSEKLCVAIIHGYLAVSNGPDALARVDSVARGETPSVASLASFKAARAKLPSSANFMIFGNMATLSDLTQKGLAGAMPGNSILAAQKTNPAVKLSGWATIAVTLRDKGLETTWSVPYDSSNPGGKLAGTIAPISGKLYERIPSGAYGLIVISQIGSYYQAKDEYLASNPEEKKSTEEFLRGFEKEFGLDIQRDLLPGLKGTLTLAVYPGREPMTDIPDGLIMLDDANGADAATMFDKVKDAIVAECNKNKIAAPALQSVQRDGAVVWTLDEATQKSMRQGIGLEQKIPLPGTPSAVHMTADLASGTPPTMQTSPAPAPVGGAPTEKKELIFATIGKSVIITSSQSLLTRAIAAYNTGSSSLASDPAYAPLLKYISPSTQNELIVALPDVMARLKPSMAGTFSDPTGPRVEDIVGLFGSKGNGLIVSQGLDAGKVSGLFFMPLDYDAAIHLAGIANKQQNMQNGQHGQPGMNGQPGQFGRQ